MDVKPGKKIATLKLQDDVDAEKDKIETKQTDFLKLC